MFRKQDARLKPRQRTGFSLIEMLVVITIILILMGALMGIYGKVLVSAKRTATQNMVMALTASLQRYAVDLDNFPPNPAGGTADDGTLFIYLNGQDGRGVVLNQGQPNEKRFGPYLSLGKEYIRNNNGKLVIVDSWGQPIHYFNSKAFVDGGGNPTYCYNPSAVDIYSTGQNLTKDPDLVEPGTGTIKERSLMKLIDDITNF